VVSLPRGPAHRMVLTRCVGAPDRILPRRDRHESAGLFIGLAPRRRDFGATGGPIFGPEPKLHVDSVLGGVLGPPVEML
jgi:hypothetical protein